MFSLIARRLSHLARTVYGDLAPSAPDDDDEREGASGGWHESSWVMARGVEVIELPPAAAASLFPDTQPAFYESEREPLAA
jgi:hypothetical protein